MNRFRLPRKLKKKYKFFRCEQDKESWRKSFFWNKDYRSWRKYVDYHAFNYYRYNQEDFNTFKADKAKNFICENCGENVFRYYEYPEHHHSEPDVLLCEGCYDNEYRSTCYLCEESYLLEDCKGEEFPKSPCAVYNPGYETDYKDNVILSGIYEAIAYPIYLSDYFSVSTEWDNLRLICSVEDWLKERPHDIDFFSGDELKAQFICDSCWYKAKKIRDSKTFNL